LELVQVERQLLGKDVRAPWPVLGKRSIGGDDIVHEAIDQTPLSEADPLPAGAADHTSKN